ncbi:MAG: TetR/AcrR family transcriptional regulator [Bacteroidota bacterium]
MPKSVLFNESDVLRKVTQLFWSKGYNGTSMQDLVDISGLNRSSIYNSFGDKFNLYEKSLKYYQQLQQEKLTQYMGSNKSPRRQIVALFEAVAEEIINQNNANGCFMSNCTTELANSNPRIHDFLVSNKKTMTDLFKGLILQARREGEIDVRKDADELASYLFSSIQGLRVTGMLDDKKSDIQGIVKQVLSVL